MARLDRRAFAAATLALLVASACSSSHGPRGGPPARQPQPSPVSPVNELSLGINSGLPSNWNILAAGTDQQALTAVADQVWPSVFTFGPDFNPDLDTALVQSATETSQNPQTIVYRINPKAVWSDGTPVTGADFVYNWQAQSGKPGSADVNGTAFTPASTSGYSDIQSVTVSASSPDVVTVVFSTPDADWTALFRHLLPAHVAERIGFDTGFSDPVADLVSDGPYVVAAYDRSGVVRLARNPTYDGSPAAALEFDLHFLPDTEQMLSALAAGQLSCARVPATAAALSTLKSSPNLTVNVAPGSTYLDLVFNAGSGPMHNADSRSALTRAITRPGVISQALAGVEPQAQPIANRFLAPGESGYTSNGTPGLPAGKAPPTTASVPEAIRFDVAPADPAAAAASQAIAEQLDRSGFQVQLVNGPPTPGTWDIALVERQLTPWPSQSIISYSSGAAANLGGISSGSLDQAIAAAEAARGSQRSGLVDQVDQAAWQAYADLPIVALPQGFACQSNVTGAAPNASPDGPAVNASGWGLGPGSS